jgi:hypothetical protein
MAFAVVFWAVKNAIDAGRLIDGVHVRKRVKNETTEEREPAPALERAA